LATTDDARVHCAVLKIRAVPLPATRAAAKGSGPGRGAACGALRRRKRPFPQDPTACSARSPPGPAFRSVMRRMY
jgi:hypothetical protein